MDLTEIKSDVKDIKKTVGEISITLAVNTQSLIDHAARTKVNEERIAQVEKWILTFLASILLAVFYFFLRQV